MTIFGDTKFLSFCLQSGSSSRKRSLPLNFDPEDSSPPTQRPRLKSSRSGSSTESASSSEEEDGQDDQHLSTTDNNVSKSLLSNFEFKSFFFIYRIKKIEDNKYGNYLVALLKKIGLGQNLNLI